MMSDDVDSDVDFAALATAVVGAGPNRTNKKFRRNYYQDTSYFLWRKYLGLIYK